MSICSNLFVTTVLTPGTNDLFAEQKQAGGSIIIINITCVSHNETFVLWKNAKIVSFFLIFLVLMMVGVAKVQYMHDLTVITPSFVRINDFRALFVVMHKV